MARTDNEWDKFGQRDPYFGVITDNNYRDRNLDENARRAFFKTGEDYVDSVMRAVNGKTDPGFRPKRALDFGCGVGRLVLPMSRYCDIVYGVDVSRSMLLEAEKNCGNSGIANVKFINNIFELKDSNEKFDLVHSYNVFQHIPIRDGLKLVAVLLALLDSQGIGILHFPFHCESAIRKIFSFVMTRIPLAHNFWNLCKKRAWAYPHMQMNVYGMNSLFRIFKAAKCDICHSEFVRQGDYETVVLYCKRNDENPIFKSAL